MKFEQRNINFSIDRRSNESAGVQIARQMKQAIIFRDLLETSFITTKVFSTRFKLALDVVEEAFRILTKDGVFYIDEEGNYRYVYREIAKFGQNSLQSMQQFITSTSKEISINLLKSEDIIIDQEYSEKTGFSVGSTVIRQERLYFGDGTPKCYAIIYFADKYRKEAFDLSASLHAIAGYQPGRGKMIRNTQALIYPDWINQLLNQPSGTAGSYSNESINFGEQLLYADYYFNYFFAINVVFFTAE